jgi:hypothetical protein
MHVLQCTAWTAAVDAVRLAEGRACVYLPSLLELMAAIYDILKLPSLSVAIGRDHGPDIAE